MNPENLRNWLNNAMSDIRAKRVLPILVLLIVAAVAIPLLLSKSGKAAAVQPLPAAPTVTAPNPAATATAHVHEPSQNYLTGPAHNPFIEKTTTAASATTSTTAGGKTAAASTATTSSASTSSGTSANPSGTQTTSDTCPNGEQPVADDGHELCLLCKHAAAALVGGQLKCLSPGAACDDTYQETYNDYGFTCVNGRLALGSGRTTTTTTTTTTPLPYSNFQVQATVQQTGVDAAPTVFHNLSRDQLLPSASGAFATFLGVRTDRQTAVFVLPSDTTVVGQGNCAPSATTCTFLTLIPDQTATITLAPSGGAPVTFRLRYAALHEVRSSASVVTVDPTGAGDVKSAEAYVPQLKTIKYAHYTGLLHIVLGSTVPVTP